MSHESFVFHRSAERLPFCFFQFVNDVTGPRIQYFFIIFGSHSNWLYAARSFFLDHLPYFIYVVSSYKAVFSIRNLHKKTVTE